MNPRQRLAIIGSGASAIYLLKHLLDEADLLRHHIGEIWIFEKSGITGMGMPYSPRTTDRFNLSNISSEEMPELPVTFGDWLRAQDPALLKELGVEDEEISDSEVYSRLSLGRYLNDQYKTIVGRLTANGITMRESPNCRIVDIRHLPVEDRVILDTADGASHRFDRVIIATGHLWAGDDKPENGFFASPWPISKLLPPAEDYHNFNIGTIGASLSAFDVIASLAHRHGDFVKESGKLVYRPFPGTGDFKITMHSAHGLLPHLQFDQDEPFREIYRHIDREGLLALVDDEGFLSMETYFDKVCRPALAKAFAKDGLKDIVELLTDPNFGLLEFVAKMTAEHDYSDAFEGMRYEMIEARKSVLEHRPIHWKEVMDDLMYTLNFHAELMPAEDHLTLHSPVMPFLLNVVAAMPLNSGNTILALHDAGKLDLISGRVEIVGVQEQSGLTTITVENGEEKSTASYRMFVDCSGQKALELEDYPFPSLVKDGCVRRARARFRNSQKAVESLPDETKEHLFRDGEVLCYHTGGVDIDGAYRLIDIHGWADPRIHDISFPHTSGVRPYSYGLQSCSHTSAILVKALLDELISGTPVDGDTETISEIYEDIAPES